MNRFYLSPADRLHISNQGVEWTDARRTDLWQVKLGRVRPDRRCRHATGRGRHGRFSSYSRSSAQRRHFLLAYSCIFCTFTKNFGPGHPRWGRKVRWSNSTSKNIVIASSMQFYKGIATYKMCVSEFWLRSHRSSSILWHHHNKGRGKYLNTIHESPWGSCQLCYDLDLRKFWPWPFSVNM